MSALASALSVAADLGTGRPVVVVGEGFANSPAHRALAERFRVIVLTGEPAPGVVAEWAAGARLEGVGLVGFGPSAGTALAAAEVLGEHARAVVLASPQGLLDAAPEAKIPTVVLIGSRDAAQPKDAVARYRRAMPRCHVVVVYDAGADIAADRPEAFADVAGDFLDRQGRFILMTETVALLD